MNLFNTCILTLFLLASTLAAHSQEAKTDEISTYRVALGGTAAISSFNAQLALGRIAKADVSTEEKLKHARGEAGGIASGMAFVANTLTKCLKHLPEDDRASMQSLVDLHKLISDQSKALIDVLKAKEQKGEGLDAAEKKYAELRAKAANVLGKKMGFPPKFVE